MRISDWSSDGCSSDLHLIRASQVSLLLFEQQVLKNDFFAQLLELEPAIVDALPGKLVSQHYPFLRHLVALGGASGTAEPLPTRSEGAIETWDSFLAHGRHIAEDVVLERADSVHPADLGGIFFSSGTTSLPKGIVHSQRASAIQWWRWPRVFAMR